MCLTFCGTHAACTVHLHSKSRDCCRGCNRDCNPGYLLGATTTGASLVHCTTHRNRLATGVRFTARGALAAPLIALLDLVCYSYSLKTTRCPNIDESFRNVWGSKKLLAVGESWSRLYLNSGLRAASVVAGCAARPSCLRAECEGCAQLGVQWSPLWGRACSAC